MSRRWEAYLQPPFPKKSRSPPKPNLPTMTEPIGPHGATPTPPLPPSTTRSNSAAAHDSAAGISTRPGHHQER